jgi:hypothetical protein
MLQNEDVVPGLMIGDHHIGLVGKDLIQTSHVQSDPEQREEKEIVTADCQRIDPDQEPVDGSSHVPDRNHCLDRAEDRHGDNPEREIPHYIGNRQYSKNILKYTTVHEIRTPLPSDPGIGLPR